MTPTQPPPFQFCISATFTAEPLEPVFQFWAAELDRVIHVRFAPFNQLIQTLLDPAGSFASNQYGVNVLLVRTEDLGQPDRIEANLRQLVDTVHSSTFPCPLIFCLCPPSPGDSGGQKHFAYLAAALYQVPGVQFLHYAEINRQYPVGRWYNPEGERLGSIPYTETYFCALGTALVRLSRALIQPPYKVIALDCDNTLWQGICGEDGPQGVLLDPPRAALHQFMLAQREQGVLLCMASKNNEEDVLETFRLHPEMPLQPRHFSCWRLNWRPKPDNLAELAAELNLGLDSFIFIDDNPKESAEVAGGIPEILALTLPADISRAPHFLAHIWAFDHAVVTEEDRNRGAYYAQAQEFGLELHRAASLDQFLATLGLRVTFSPLRPETLARVSQLTQRTSQFNCTTIRRTEAEIQALVHEGRLECRTIEVSDRFGDYGLTGVILFSRTAQELAVDTFLLSCRVLGRGVEHRVLAWLGETALAEGLSFVTVPLRRTAKNSPALEFLRSAKAGREIDSPGECHFRFSADALGGLAWKPSAPPRTARPVLREVRVSAPRRFFPYARIAQDLSTPEQVLDAMRRLRLAGQTPAPALLYRSETERRLAAIWADLLGKNAVSASDNFFDLGGHSLLVVLLLVRVREAFGVDLAIDEVYSGTQTLAGMAARIDMRREGGLLPEEYSALLAEVEKLSDDEVRRMLEVGQASWPV